MGGMKTRQFKQLAALNPRDRTEAILEGLELIAESVALMIDEIDRCAEAKAFRANRVMRNAGREEAGKFLLLLDLYRTASPSQKLVSDHLKLAGNHTVKLVYAQMADFSIGHRKEMVEAIDAHRQRLYLDGPNDFDWIVQNHLIAEREGALYVDYVESEGAFEWSGPSETDWAMTPCGSMYLVTAIAQTGLLTVDGLGHLKEAWASFDPKKNTYFNEWADRTRTAIDTAAPEDIRDEAWAAATGTAIELWPMPIIELKLTPDDDVTEAGLIAERAGLEEAWLWREFGDPYS